MTVQAGDGRVEDVLTLKFEGVNSDGSELHELKAAHVADVLEGIVGLASDFAKAGAFGSGMPPEVYVRPAEEGSFILEVVSMIAENPEAATAVIGTPTVGQIVWWATKSIRAEVKDFDYLENGNVKVAWQDDTVAEVPAPVWRELQKRRNPRKRHLRKLMAPLSDDRVTALQVSDGEDEAAPTVSDAPREFTLERIDYHLARPEPEVEETQDIFEIEAQMAAIDFESGEKWRVRTKDGSRAATVEDADFLRRVDRGLAIHKDDVFRLQIREDRTAGEGRRTSRKWTVLEVLSHRGRIDDGAQRTE